jgi:hypothetical protein
MTESRHAHNQADESAAPAAPERKAR